MSQTVEQALARMNLYTDGTDYRLVRLPARAITAAAGIIAEVSEPFSALIVDKDEVSLVIAADVCDDFIKRLPDHTTAPIHYRLLTLDVVLEPTLVGFLARISRVLADAGVPLLALSAFSRDHLFIPADSCDIAVQALQRLQLPSQSPDRDVT
jgi:hypothetical protein